MITVAEAAARFPELGPLYTVMTQQGPAWVFAPLIRDDQLEGLKGARFWPDGAIDRIGFTSQTDAAACRLDPAREMVWFHSGTVGDVVAAILDRLPPPSHPGAPRRPEPRVIAASGLALPGPRITTARPVPHCA